MRSFLFALVLGFVFAAAGNMKATTYADWQGQHFTSGDTLTGPQDNPAHDGIPNLMKYALGLDPHQYQGSAVAPLSIVDGHLALTCNYDTSLMDITYVVEYSPDLINWYRGSNNVVLTSTVNLQGSQYVVTYAAATPLAINPKGFMRLTIVEGDDLPASWQLQYFGHTGVDPNADPDSDGISNFDEYVNGTDPNDYYNGYAPSLAIAGGGNQLGAPSTMLTVPLSISVEGEANAPVQATVTQGTALLAASPTGTASSTVTVPTSYVSGLGNVAQVYLQTGASVSDSSTVTIMAPGYPSSAITTTVGSYDPSIPPPTNLVATPTSPTTVQLTWTNNSSTGTIIQQSLDGGATWQTIATVDPGVSTYTVTGLTPDEPAIFKALSDSADDEGGGSGSSGGAGGSAPTPPTPPTTPLSQPVLMSEVHGAWLIKYGTTGFQTYNSPVPNYYLQVTFLETVSGSWNGGGTATSTKTTDPLTGHVTGTGSNPNNLPFDSNLAYQVNSDTSETGSYSFNGASITQTLSYSNPNTTDMLKANVLTLVPPFTNTFTAESNYAYYNLAANEASVTLDALQYKFEINSAPQTTMTWDDEFIPSDGSTPTDNIQSWSGDNQTETPPTVLSAAALEAGKSGTHEIFPLLIERDGQPINGSNNTVVAGQQINLSVYAPGLNITAYQWTIPGMTLSPPTAFKDYQDQNTQNPLVPLQDSDLTGSTVSFYWSDAQDNRVFDCMITLNGKNYHIPVTLNVKRPTVTGDPITAKVAGVVAADNNYQKSDMNHPTWLHFGQAENGNDGMTFTAAPIIPPVDASGKSFQGKFTWVQVISNDSTVGIDANGNSVPINTSSGLDNTFPYDLDHPQLNPESDSPGTSLGANGYVSETRSFKATMYLMWKPINLPSGENAVWIPLSYVTWSFSGTAQWNSSTSTTNGNWSLSSQSSPGSVGTVVPDSPTVIEPQWTTTTVNKE